MAANRVFAFLLLYILFESSENSELCQNMAIKDCAKDLTILFNDSRRGLKKPNLQNAKQYR